ncbi:hypothetical protein PIB30_006177 [Stylosanthes scabra]|uniref:Uncharacterized protein n=1 Tax=Stylosanthes scabra TaxID=79078 RepID=A0ABU6Y275_9FABA|nr:hypothetical protein [Stylosanthes scabra]
MVSGIVYSLGDTVDCLPSCAFSTPEATNFIPSEFLSIDRSLKTGFKYPYFDQLLLAINTAQSPPDGLPRVYKGEISSPQVRLLNPTQWLCSRRLPNPYLVILLLHATYLSHKPPAFCLGTSGYTGSPKSVGLTFIQLARDDRSGMSSLMGTYETPTSNEELREAAIHAHPPKTPFNSNKL